MIPKCRDLVLASAALKPIAASPRFSSSRTAAARRGIRKAEAEIVDSLQLVGVEHDLKPLRPHRMFRHSRPRGVGY
jgi:hypothetical protein